MPDPAPAGPSAPAHPPAGLRWWWRLMETRVGVVPVPVLATFVAALGYFLGRGSLPPGVAPMIAVLAVGGFVCAQVGKRLPLLRSVGGGAILATFVPSALVHYRLLPAPLVEPIVAFTASTQVLYLFITAVVVGSILGMDRAVLVGGALKVFAPLAAGSLAALAVGTGVGTALGLGARHTLLFVVVPIMAGGLGEGAIPLSLGYARALDLDQSEAFARLLPPVMFGSLTAVLLAGLLNLVGRRRPHLTGRGRLGPGEPDEADARGHAVPPAMDVDHIAAAGLFAVSLYLVGLVAQEAVGLPAPVALLLLAVAAKLLRAVPPKTQEGAYVVYRFFRVAVTYPLLFAVGVAMTPWAALADACHWRSLVVIVTTVGTLVGTGWAVGRRVGLYPVEAALVNACHSGQGGTGDVAILTAANRLQLMPFAQIATRLGGAATVTLTLLALRGVG